MADNDDDNLSLSVGAPLRKSASHSLASASIARDLQNTGLSTRRPRRRDSSVTTNSRRTSDLSRSAPSSRRLHRSRTPSNVVTAGQSRPVIVVPAAGPQGPEYQTQPHDAELSREDERDLLQDNNLIPTSSRNSQSWRRRSSGTSAKSAPQGILGRAISAIRMGSSSYSRLEEEDGEQEPGGVNADGSAHVSRSAQEPLQAVATERTALLSGHKASGPQVGAGSIAPTSDQGNEEIAEDLLDRKWEDAVAAGKIQTTMWRETKVIGKYSRSLILTFLLQYSIAATSVFVLGHLGEIELGASSVGSMTAGITGYSVYFGLATSLDTLCAQAYGSGHKELVGLNLQRMVLLLWAVSIPIGLIWFNAARILQVIIPEKETAQLAGLYLKIAFIGAPGFAVFEAMKRYVQAQGMFTATLYVLLIVAPLNVLMHYLLVYRVGLGFVGAPISVAISEALLPIVLIIYIVWIAPHGLQCWGGFSRNAFRNWWPMVKLALPGLSMVLAEVFAFEVLTLSASWIGPGELAAQSILSTTTTITWHIPFSMSVAASTRVANLIGAGLVDAARLSARTAVLLAACAGLVNMLLLALGRNLLPHLFTSVDEVILAAASVLPVCAAFQLFDSLTATLNGILRGIGRQDFGGYLSLLAYYLVALPISFGLCFGLHLDLVGLWIGPAVGLALMCSVVGVFTLKTDWNRSVEEAKQRAAGEGEPAIIDDMIPDDEESQTTARANPSATATGEIV